MVEFRVVQIPSGYEEARKAQKAELDAFHQIKIGSGKLGLEETVRRAQLGEVTGSDYQIAMEKANIEDMSGPVWHRISAFTGTFPGLTKIFKQIRKNTSDLSDLFEVIKLDFFSTNEELIFSQDAVGKTPNYTPIDENSRYGKYKIYKNGSVWPLLFLRGNLRKSLTDVSDTDAVGIVTPKSLKLGTNNEYAFVHQYGIKLPLRPPVSFIVGGRFEKWKTYATNFLTRVKQENFQ